jgi:molybdopterin-binding protein
VDGRLAARYTEDPMELSARNRLAGVVKSIRTGNVMAEVVIDVAGQEVVSAITKASVDRLQLKVGDRVFAIVKATEVIIGK